MAEVYIDENESIESALRRFNKKVQNDGILTEFRRRQFFEKPSVVRKKKRATKKRKSARTPRSARG